MRLLMKYLNIPYLLILLMMSQAAIAQNVVKINHYFSNIASAQGDKERLVYNDSLTNSIISYLEIAEDKIRADLSNVNYLGHITSADSLIRILSWNIPVDGRNNLYNCIIYNVLTESTILLRGEDGLSEMESDTVIESKEWYGSLYYDIQALGGADEMTYILLGFDPDNINMNAKVIEILHFDEDGKPVFGKKVFSDGKNETARIIFKYSPLATMMLKFNPARTRIIFDHLSPSSSQFEGQYRYYGPDFSYDALEIKDDKLVLIEDIDLRNTDNNE